MDDLSPAQDRLFRYLVRYHQQHGYAPSIREITRAIGLRSTSSTVYQLRHLEDKGFIRRTPYVNRAIVITKEAPRG